LWSATVPDGDIEVSTLGAHACERPVTRVPHPARRVSALPRGHAMPSWPAKTPLREKPLTGGMRGSPLVDSARRVSVALAAGVRMRAGLLPRVRLATAAQRLRARCSIASAVLTCRQA
jgi:hypothetical protein